MHPRVLGWATFGMRGVFVQVKYWEIGLVAYERAEEAEAAACQQRIQWWAVQ